MTMMVVDTTAVVMMVLIIYPLPSKPNFRSAIYESVLFQDGYWGLSNSLSGCNECACDVGGSYDNQCEKITGQCRCRKGINGRKCDRVKPGHYFPLPDHLVYESEEATAIGVSTTFITHA